MACDFNCKAKVGGANETGGAWALLGLCMTDEAPAQQAAQALHLPALTSVKVGICSLAVLA